MCADAWLSTHGIPVSTAMSFLDGARSILRPAGYLTGAYGFADFVYAAQDGAHADRFWLCGAESGVRPGIHMYQWNNGAVSVDGLTCDLNKQYIPMFEGAPGGGGIGGDDMPLTDEDIDKLLSKKTISEVLPSTEEPNDDPNQDYASLGHQLKYSKFFAEQAFRTVEKVLTAVQDIAERVARLEASGIPVKAEVDWTAGAKAINDEDDRRDRDGDPKTGQVS
jgi:hypothetical protein